MREAIPKKSFDLLCKPSDRSIKFTGNVAARDIQSKLHTSPENRSLNSRAYAVRSCKFRPAARIPNGPMGAFMLVGAKSTGCEITFISNLQYNG